MLHNVKPEVTAFATPPIIPDEVVIIELEICCKGIYVCFLKFWSKRISVENSVNQ